MDIEELKDILHKLDSNEICELLSNKKCEKCFCYTKEKECVIKIFSEGMLKRNSQVISMLDERFAG